MSFAIDGRSIASLSDFYARLAEHSTVPSYFGRNLDALDEIAGDGHLPRVIEWNFVEQSRNGLKSDFDRLASVLRDHAIGENMTDDTWTLIFE